MLLYPRPGAVADHGRGGANPGGQGRRGRPYRTRQLTGTQFTGEIPPSTLQVLPSHFSHSSFPQYSGYPVFFVLGFARIKTYTDELLHGFGFKV